MEPTMENILRECECGATATTIDELELFTIGNNYLHGRKPTCKVCDNRKQRKLRRRKDPLVGNRPKLYNSKREERIFKKYGIRDFQYDEMFIEQKGKCKICNCLKSDDRNGRHKHFAIDHCHKTNKVRGLLCMSCNTGIGHLADNKDFLKNAIAYLS